MPNPAVKPLTRSVRLALRPGPAPLAVSAALRALATSTVILLTGVALGDLQIVGIAYFGAACAATYATGAAYRSRTTVLIAQGLGAAAGIAAGVLLPHHATMLIATAAVAGAVSGIVGAASPYAPAFGLMLSVGVAFGQFGGSTLQWWQQCLWYLIGTAAVGAVALAPAIIRRGQPQRQAAADVFARSADLCQALGTPTVRDARTRLAAASAVARTGRTLAAAELTAFAVAGLYGENRPVPAAVIAAIRTAGQQALRGEPIDVPLDVPPAALSADPQLQALADALSLRPTRRPALPPQHFAAALRSLRTSTALANGARLALCMAVATAAAIMLKRPGEHALWLPLTTAVVLRPEYGSVFVRAVNRISGTVAGAIIAAVILWAGQPGVMAAVAAAIALSGAVLTAPKLYAFYVTGVTASTLLSASLGHTVLALPGVRIADTILGAAVAIVFGYLLWPGARRLPSAARLDLAVDAALAYLDQAVTPPADRMHWQARRDDAYRLAHLAYNAAQVAITEPPPVSTTAMLVLPRAAELEDIIDEITSLANHVDATADVTARADAVRTRLEAIRKT